MNNFPRLNPNILLTETCNGACKFCFAKNQMAMAEKKEMDLNDFRELLKFLKKNQQTKVRLMGGEPTLHSHFKEIIDLAIENEFNVIIFTNGFFSEELAHWMAKKGESLQYSINLAAIAFAPEEKKRSAENNLKILSESSKISGSLTVDSAMFKYARVIELVQKNKFQSIRIAIANNMVNNSLNNSIADDYKDIIATVIQLVDRLKKTGVFKIFFNCGFTPCMFQKEQIYKLKKTGVKINGWGCSGKIGSFDITADLRMFPCFSSQELEIKKILNFRKLKSAQKFSDKLLKYFTKKIMTPIFPECEKCAYYKRGECMGPCLGYAFDSSNEKNITKELKKEYSFRITKKLLHAIYNFF